MKKNGSLKSLGKLNLLIMGMIGLLVMYLMVKISKQKDEYTIVDIQVGGSSGWQQGSVQAPSWLVDNIKKGDQELSVSGKKTAEVMDIQSYEDGNNKVTFLKVKLLVDKNKKLNTYKYKQKALEVGSTIDLLLGTNRIYGSVTSIEDENSLTNNDQKYLKIRIILYGQYGWFAENIKIGDKMETGFGGEQILSEVLSKTVRKSQTISKNYYGLVDLELEMKVLVNNRQGLNYFANYQPIKVGNLMYIPMKNYNLYGAYVMGIENEN